MISNGKSAQVQLVQFLSIFLAFWSMSSAGAPKAELWNFWQQADETNSETIDHSAWQLLLSKYVHEDRAPSLFAYSSVNVEDKNLLGAYLSELQQIDPRDYRSEEQKPYWINLYNALTVQLILDNYPVKSITKLGKGFFAFGPWDDSIAEIAGKPVTLNDIEHRILRPIWPDPRIHFAVNCASISCPDLQAVAFTAENTETLLERAARDYLSSSRAMSFQADGSLQLSSIFDWYAVDFGNNQSEVLNALSGYAPEGVAEKLRSYDGAIDYDYDWNLNEYIEQGAVKEL